MYNDISYVTQIKQKPGTYVQHIASAADLILIPIYKFLQCISGLN